MTAFTEAIFFSRAARRGLPVRRSLRQIDTLASREEVKQVARTLGFRIYEAGSQWIFHRERLKEIA